MEKEIGDLKEQVSKSINEIAKDFELKYRDFVPSFIGVDDCQDKIQKNIRDGNEQLKKLEAQINSLEKSVVQAKEEAPHKKRQVVQEFLGKLENLSEMERCLNAFWLNPADEAQFDPLINVRSINRLEELYKKLESESANNMEAINERIMPLLFMEIASQKTELCQQLDEFYDKFLSVKANDRLSPPVMLMSIHIPSTKLVTECFSALQRLDMFHGRLENLVETVWEHFCTKLLYAEEDGEQLLTINTEQLPSGRTITFGIKKEVKTTKKPEPASVFRGLNKLFNGLQQAFGGVRVQDRFLIDLFGECISAQLISALEKGCLNPAIPFEREKALVKQAELRTMTTDFLQSMKDKGFFMQPVDHMFGKFFDSFERISVDRRCLHYVVTSRDLIKEPYIELVQVGSATDERDENAADIMHSIDEKLSIKVADADLATSRQWDKYHLNTYQFQRCMISTSIFKLMNLVQDVLREAAEADSELEACRLVTTARNIIDMFLLTAPDYHSKALASVPQIAGVFYNNCQFICHRIMTLPPDVMERTMKVSKISQQNCAFTEKFPELRKLGADKLELHIVHARRQLSATIGEGGDDLFFGLLDDKAYNRWKRTLDSCVLQIEQTAAVWKEVLPFFILAQSVGALVTHLLSLINEAVLRKEDITSPDAGIMADMFEHLAQKCKQIMTIDGKPMVQKVCEKSYYMLLEIIFCLKGSLAEIGHRWCEGKGPLAAWMEAAQVKQLIRAIFQNTDRRAQLLAQIN